MYKDHKKKHTGKLPDISLLVCFLLLILFGTVTVYNSSLVSSVNIFGGQFHFLFHQLAWLSFGIALGVFFYLFPYIRLLPIFRIGLYVSLVLLFITSLGGLSSLPILKLFLGLITNSDFYNSLCPVINGARRWIIFNPEPFPALPLLGRLRLQPAEAIKFFLLGYLAFSLENLTKHNKNPYVLTRLIFLFILISGLILMQPDLGSLILIGAVFFGMLFLAEVPWKFFLITIPLGILAAVPLIFLSPYRRERLLTFFTGGSDDPLGSGYQISQVLIALGSGGWFGLGFGNSRQKHGYIPEVATDSIFAVLGEELGWVGVLIFLACYFYIFLRSLRVSLLCSEPVGKLLSGGVVLWFSAQLIMNLFAVTALLPFTGIPLPLISYGGSSLLFSVSAIGLLLNVSKNR